MVSGSLRENWVIESVPEDVWRGIFKMAVIDDPDIEAASGTTRTVENTLHLSHACSRFYNIIADIPDLWIDIVLRMDCRGNTSPREGLIILAFKRVSTKPLTLSLAYITATVINLPNNISSVQLGSILPLALNTRLLDATCIGSIFVDHHAPLLETLEVVGSLRRPTAEEYEIGLYVQGLIPFVRRAVKVSPKLHILILRRPHAAQPVMVHDTQIYCQRLVNLEMLEGSMLASELYLILSSAKALAPCKIGCLVGSIPERARAFFMRAIPPPYPKTLVLRQDQEWNQEKFLLFTNSSALSLEHLVLSREQSTEHQRLEFLSLLPSLKSLETHPTFDYKKLESGPHLLTDALAKCMTTWDISRGEFSICPRLESFGYDKDAVEVDVDDPVLSPMIEHRWNGAPGRKYLKAVPVCGAGRCSPYDISRMLVLQKEGLDVTFYDAPCSKTFTCKE